MQDREERGASALSTRAEDRVERPKLPAEYGVPEGREDMLPWEWVVERLDKARNYWVCTAHPTGRPHAVPVWALWLDGVLYFDGHPKTQWGRNLARNPAISVHLESGDEVVILEGKVEDIPSLDRALAERLARASNAKYNYSTEVSEMIERGLYALRPQVVYAWSEFPKTLTKWRFDK